MRPSPTTMTSRAVLVAALLAAPAAASLASPAAPPYEQPTAPRPSDAAAIAVVDAGIARMGGRAALDSIRTVQYELMTQWLAMTPAGAMPRDAPSYERQTEYRDYVRRTWRNVRKSATPAGWSEIVDIVLDTVGVRRLPPNVRPTTTNVSMPALPVDGWVPLNIAYVDERRELFAWAPERVVLLLRDATDLAMSGDTVIGGESHRAVRATVNGFPFTAFFHKATRLPTMVRFRADERNDFGLAPWGPMDVEILYSRWTYNAPVRALLPRQWDTRRVGMAYKRMSVLSAVFNTALPADSLAFPDAVARSYLALGRKPMGDQPIDSVVPVADGAALALYGSGAPAGAVRLGNEWLFLDGGNLPLNAERAASAIAAKAPAGTTTTGGALVTANRPGSAAVWASRGNRLLIAGSRVSDATMLALRNHGAPLTTIRRVARGEWIRARGGVKDSLWIEPVELTNGPSMLVYRPRERWAYTGAGASQADVEIVGDVIRAHGWAVDRVAVPGRIAGLPLAPAPTPR